VESIGPAYLLTAPLDVASLRARLPARFELGEATVRAGERTFYDTFDGRLRAKGLELVHSDGRFTLVRGDRELATLDWAQAPRRIFCEELPEGRLRTALAPVCDIRALLASVTVRSERRAVPVLDRRAKTVARLVAEEAAVVGANGQGRLRPRLTVVGVRGYDKARAELARVLADDVGLAPAAQSLHDEAVAADAGSPHAALPPAGEPVTIDMPADVAAAKLLRHQLDVIEANLPGSLADLDSEFLHDFRVAVRRSRSLQRELKTVFPPEQLAGFRAEFRWLQEVTGPSRDLDVYLLDFDLFRNALPESQRVDLEPLRDLLAEHRVAERERMERALRSERTGAILAAWRDFLERLPEMPVDDRRDAAMPIAELAARRIARVYKQMIRMGAAVGDASPPTALHELRKKGKELRYLLEFFAPLFSAKVTKPMVRSLKALQDTLGRFQDREVQAALVRTLAGELAARDESGRTLMALGVLAERLDDQQAAARAEFAARFAKFSSKRRRELVRRTFT
jgi:CHAD domain-containing protein